MTKDFFFQSTRENILLQRFSKYIVYHGFNQPVVKPIAYIVCHGFILHLIKKIIHSPLKSKYEPNQSHKKTKQCTLNKSRLTQAQIQSRAVYQKLMTTMGED